MILNTPFPYIRTDKYNHLSDSIEYKNYTFIKTIRNFNDGNDYFYIEFFLGNAFEVYDINTVVSSDILRKIKTDNKTFLYLCNIHEAFTTVILDKIYEILVCKENIPANKIIVANEAYDLKDTSLALSKKYNKGIIKTDWIRGQEAHLSLRSHHLNLDNITLDKNNNFNKRFLCFNRRWRLQRLLLITLLKYYNILDKGFVSLLPGLDYRNWHNSYPILKSECTDHQKITDILNIIETDMINMNPLYLDYNDVTVNMTDIDDVSLPFYRDSLLSVVTETNFFNRSIFNGSRYLSEKSFKPIAIGHPFILLTVSHSLELLRLLGYKTFHPFIDETYDTVSNDYDRILLVVNEIKKICEYDQNQLHTFIDNVKPIVKFNQAVLKSKSINFINNFDVNCIYRNFVNYDT